MQVMDLGRFLLIRIVQNYSHLILPLVVIDLPASHTSEIFQIEIDRVSEGTEEARNVQDDMIMLSSNLKDY